MKTLRIDLYTAPGCSACYATKRWLTLEGLEFNEIDVSQDDEAQQHCRALGYAELPVVVALDAHWSGFRYDKLKELKAMAVNS